MKKLAFLLLGLTILTGCHKNNSSFECTITGEVTGKDSGNICLFSSLRVGDEMLIPIINGSFSFKDTFTDVFTTSLAFNEQVETGMWRGYPVVIEPGIIRIKLNYSNIDSSRTFSGKYNLAIRKMDSIMDSYRSALNDESLSDEVYDSLEKVYTDSIYLLTKENLDNYGGIYLLKKYGAMFNDSLSSELFNSVTDPELRNMHDFKLAYSKFLAKTGNYNKTGEKAYLFSLPDSSGHLIHFQSVNKNKIVFVESSGSWCGNQTRQSHELDTIYARFKDKGFEIITVVFESRLDRWKKWLKREHFPWINVVEMEFGNPHELFLSELIFSNGDYLVDKNGIVIANHLSAPKLYTELLKILEPDQYKTFLENKWKLPVNTYVIDRNKKIGSFNELLQDIKNKPILIDCWASWCSPCIAQFKKNKYLSGFLEQNNITPVYICFDRNMDETKWLNIIRKYNLKGYHMRANKDFIRSFTENTGWNGKLPSYILVNTENTVKILNSPPEDMSFYDEILESLQ